MSAIKHITFYEWYKFQEETAPQRMALTDLWIMYTGYWNWCHHHNLLPERFEVVATKYGREE